MENQNKFVVGEIEEFEKELEKFKNTTLKFQRINPQNKTILINLYILNLVTEINNMYGKEAIKKKHITKENYSSFFDEYNKKLEFFDKQINMVTDVKSLMSFYKLHKYKQGRFNSSNSNDW